MTAWRTVPYPPELVRRYRAAGLWCDRTIPQALGEVVRLNPDRAAVITSTDRWTYAELDARSEAVAAGIVEAGIRPGEAVILQLTNGIHTVATWYGLLKAGAIPVCTLAFHRRHEIEQIARLTRAVGHVVQADLPKFDLVEFAGQIDAPSIRTLFTIGATPGPGAGIRIEDLAAATPTSEQRAGLRRIPEETDLAAPAVFQLSGGTTGTPKIIPRLHPEYWYNAFATASWWKFTPDDRLAFGLPLIHNAGLVNALHAAHSVGAALLLGTPAAGDLLGLMSAERATWLMSPPGIMLDYLAHPGFDDAFAGVANCVLTAATVPRSLFDALEARGVHVAQAFGMTEGLITLTPSDASAELRAATVGLPISPFDEIVLLEPGSDVPAGPGMPGELCVRGPYTIRGYLDDPARNAEAFTSQGFYRTGDIMAPHLLDGFVAYSVHGRIKDLINRGGEKVNADEVEALLRNHPAVADAALVAMPDERLGERACAYIVVRERCSPPTLGDLCTFLEAQGLAKFKWPERVELIDVLPRTSVGKIFKPALREDITVRLAR